MSHCHLLKCNSSGVATEAKQRLNLHFFKKLPFQQTSFFSSYSYVSQRNGHIPSQVDLGKVSSVPFVSLRGITESFLGSCSLPRPTLTP